MCWHCMADFKHIAMPKFERIEKLMYLFLFFRLLYPWERPSLYMATSEIGIKGGKERVVVHLSFYFCVLSTSLQILVPKEDHMVGFTQEMGESGIYESTQKSAVCCKYNEVPTEVGIPLSLSSTVKMSRFIVIILFYFCYLILFCSWWSFSNCKAENT